MKPRAFLCSLLILLLCGSISLTSCSRKTGCPAYEEVHTKRDKNGNPKKGGTSNLFPKEMRKKGR